MLPENVFSALFDALSAHICVLDHRGTIVAVNRAWKQFAAENNLDPGSADPGVNYLDVCERAVENQSQEGGLAAAGIRRVLAGEQDLFQLEYPCHSSDTLRWFNTRVTRLEINQAVYAVIAHENVTERRLAEEALKASETRYAAVFHANLIATALVNATTGRYVEVNQVFLDMVGHTRASVIGHTSEDLSLWVDAERFHGFFTQLLREGRLSDVTIDLRAANGDIRTLAISADLLMLDGQHFALLMGRDVTAELRLQQELADYRDRLQERVQQRTTQLEEKIHELERTEQALREAQLLNQLIIENVPGGVLHITPRGILAANHEAMRILRLQEDTGPDKVYRVPPDLAIITEEGDTFDWRENPLINATLNTGEIPVPAILGILQPDGETIWVLVTAAPMWDVQSGAVTGVVATAVDITQSKVVETALRQLLAQEQQLSELKTRFITAVSHEFRTPLASILSSSEILERHHERLETEGIRKHHNRIRQAVRSMVALLDDVLFIAASDAQEITPNFSLVEIEELCREIIDDLQEATEHTHTVRLVSAGPVTMLSDRKLLHQIIANLLSNAVKYSPEGSTVEIIVSAKTEDEAEAVTVQVRDEGIGIPPADLEQILQAFHRGSNIGLAAGLGLGLTIVERAVRLLNGAIRVESALNAGSRFTIVLPLIRP